MKKPTPDEARRILARRQLARDHFGAWCQYCLMDLGFKPGLHHQALIRELAMIDSGESDRLMVMMPPGSAKTMYSTVLFPPWYMRNPGRDVVLASYSVKLAERNSRNILGVVKEHGHYIGLETENDAVSEWRTNTNGSVFAAGVDGQLTGRRADVIIIDDPFKGRDEANSELMRDGVWDWYWAAAQTRLKAPSARRRGGAIVLIMTRWHEDDLCGRLLKSDPDRWRVLKIAAQAGDQDVLGRQPGEFLWDDDPNYRYGEILRAAKADLEKNGAMREWWSLYQQEPRPGAGGIFQPNRIALGTLEPGRSARCWDLASTVKIGTRDPDYTVGVKMTATESGIFLVEDVIRFRATPDERDRRILEAAEQDGREIPIGLPQEPGQAGVSQVQYLARKLAGYMVQAIRPSGSKATRAAAYAAQVNVGNVRMLPGAWNRAYLEELGGFPAGAHDDQIDASADAFNHLALKEVATPAHRTFIPFMSR